MDVVAVVAVAILILLAVVIGHLLVDRSARNSAWRRIAAERRQREGRGHDAQDTP